MLRWLLLLFALPVWAQLPQGGITGIASGNTTPILINFRGGPSTEGQTVNTKTNNTCATQSICTQLPDATLAGNGIVVFYTYKAASGNTANVPAVHDCTTYGCTTNVDTFTSCGTEANDSTTSIYMGCRYVLTATTGSRNITVTWTANVTQASVHVAQFRNITAADTAYHTNSGAATTTFTAGSGTSTANGDLWFQFACATAATMPQDVGAWTLGSQAGITWVGDLVDRRNACAIQHGIQTTAGALNPQITTATSNRFISLGMAFKAGSSGTPPSGMYIVHLNTVNTSTTSAGTRNFQFPTTTGNLVVGMPIGGGQHVTAMSDTTNSTWKSCGPPSVLSNVDTVDSATYYFPNATGGVLAVSATTVGGNGDLGPTIFYDIAGAATTQECGRAAILANINAAASTFTGMSNFAPSSSSGIILYGLTQGVNTVVGITSPATGVWDANTSGGENLSGPWPFDQNNGVGHFYNTDNTPHNLTWSETSASNAIQGAGTEIASFQAVGSTLYPIEVGRGSSTLGQGSSNSTHSIITSYVPAAGISNRLFAGMACTLATTGTITVSDSVNGSWTQADTTSNLNGYRCGLFYKAAAAATTTTITATYGTANASFNALMIEELANVTALDSTGGNFNRAAITGNGSGVLTGTTTSATSVANTIAVEFAECNGSCTLNGGASLTAGVNLSPWTILNYDTNAGCTGCGDISGYLALGATGTVTPKAWDSVASNADVVAVMVFKP